METQEQVKMQEPVVAGTTKEPVVRFESPPASEMPARQEEDGRGKLLELAAELARTRNRRLMMEYLRLRRAQR